MHVHALSNTLRHDPTASITSGLHAGAGRALASSPASGRNASPETKNLVFSFMALTDAAPLIIAKVRGFFQEQGLDVTLRKASSWTGLRDEINAGRSHGGQLLFSMPVAAACGLLGTRQKPLIIPWVLSRNGQAITVSNRFRNMLQGDAKALRPLAIEARDAGRPLVFGHTLRVGTHALWLRYWLAAGSIHPGNDVALITVPPIQMVDNMRTARMDGFCAGEPWHARALADNIGYTAITSQEIWADHPEKVLAITEAFASANPRSVIAALKAIHQASTWLDDPANIAEAAQILSGPDFLNCTSEWISSRLGGTLHYGDGRTAETSTPMTFARRGANRPRPGHAIWFLTQLRRWGLHYGAPDYQGIASRVMRPEFHAATLADLGVIDPSPAEDIETLFDGKPFDPSMPEEYARSFTLHNLIN